MNSIKMWGSFFLKEIIIENMIGSFGKSNSVNKEHFAGMSAEINVLISLVLFYSVMS